MDWPVRVAGSPVAALIYANPIPSPMEEWRLLDTPPMSAARNMALDQVVLRARSEDRVPNTLRFMQVRPRAVLVGFHQSVEQEVRLEYCKRNGIEINRRITGGGALFFDESQIGWEIYASRDTPGIPRKVEALYRKMCEGAVFGLERLGIKARFRPKNDIEVGRRKISGTGGTFEGDAFLFQGTLLVDFDAGTMLRALRIPIEKLKDKEVRAVKRRVTWLSEELGAAPSSRAIKKALAEGFARSLCARFRAGGLTPYEKRLFKTTLPRFRSDEWVFGIRRPPESRLVLKSALKTKGGLIRVSLVTDPPARRINYALITGDFFAFPRDTILNLEARLKDLPLDERRIRSTVGNYFKEEAPKIPFTRPEDFAGVILEAAKKARWTRYGIPREELNSVFFVLEPPENLRGARHLLLPYCAKPVDCRYRKRDGCAECGRCAVGDMYALARLKGLIPVSINSYHHLEKVLKDIRRRAHGAGRKGAWRRAHPEDLRSSSPRRASPAFGGARGDSFVGSCCEAFFIKHRQDLERLGVPGVLVDIDSRTCYDLYKDAEAHAGKFDRRTRLKTGLFRTVIDRFGAGGAPEAARGGSGGRPRDGRKKVATDKVQ
jgi:lipoate-protein ligase A